MAENEGAVRFGYVAYLLYSVLFAVTITLLARLVEHDLAMGVRRLVIGFAVASAIARSLGIVRWLGPMPELAESYNAASDDAQRYAIARVYDALNSDGGTIGLSRSQVIPRWIAVWGAISTIALAVSAAELFGADLGPILTITVTVVQLWFLATGVWLLTRGRRHFNA